LSEGDTYPIHVNMEHAIANLIKLKHLFHNFVFVHRNPALVNNAIFITFVQTQRKIGIIMKKYTLLSLTVLISFCFGFGVKTFMDASSEKADFKKVTGIGGIFFKCKDPKKMREWYKTNLGLQTNAYGAVFEWRHAVDSTKKGYSQWSPFSEKTKYFEPSTKEFMINYRIANMDKLVAQLKKDGITITDSVETAEYGKFVHIMDIEGNKIELWEPNDVAYEQLGKKMGSTTTK